MCWVAGFHSRPTHRDQRNCARPRSRASRACLWPMAAENTQLSCLSSAAVRAIDPCCHAARAVLTAAFNASVRLLPCVRASSLRKERRSAAFVPVVRVDASTWTRRRRPSLVRLSSLRCTTVRTWSSPRPPGNTVPRCCLRHACAVALRRCLSRTWRHAAAHATAPAAAGAARHDRRLLLDVVACPRARA